MRYKSFCALILIFAVFFAAACDHKEDSGKYSGGGAASAGITVNPQAPVNNEAAEDSKPPEPLPVDISQLKSITIDGKLDDWSNVKPTAVDDLNDAQYNGADIEFVYAVQDLTNVYIAAVVKGAKPSIGFIFDTDNKDKGEYTYNYSTFIDTIFSFRLEPEQKDATPGRLNSFAAADGIVERMVPLANIGKPYRQRMQVLTNTDKPDFTVCDQLNDWFEVPVYQGNLAFTLPSAELKAQNGGNGKQNDLGVDPGKDPGKKEAEKTATAESAKSQGAGGGIIETEEQPADDIDDGTIRKGHYVYFGKYYGEPILWECIKKDGKSVMLVSKHIICLKAFDAAESGKHDGEGDYADKFGSNIWANSNIREWLNSDQKEVKYSTQPPVKEALWDGHNDYAQEAGFLTNFSKGERDLIKPVSHDGVEDKVFLLSEKEVRELLPKAPLRVKKLTPQAIANSSYNYKFSENSEWFWLTRTKTGIFEGWLSTCHVRTVDSELNGEIGVISDTHACRGNGGIAPALYLTADTFISGKGTLDDPYIITGGQ